MIKLSVNVNKIATLRNARGGGIPSVIEFALAALGAGADGITVHPRPDERHIRRKDVLELKAVLGDAEFNIEGYPDERYLDLIREIKPDQATLVPDPPDVITSNAGWDVIEEEAFLRDTLKQIKPYVGRVSLFMETDISQIEKAKEVGADRIEFYTGPFAEDFAIGLGEESFSKLNAAAHVASDLGLQINAGHDLNLENLSLLKHLEGLCEVSIGHAIVCDALWMGWTKTIQEYQKMLKL